MSEKDRSNDTQMVRVSMEKEIGVDAIIEQVYHALVDKGYNPVSQIVGYIMSGDPTYITGHQGARSLIMKAERDELLEELLKFYVEYRLKKPEKKDE